MDDRQHEGREPPDPWRWERRLAWGKAILFGLMAAGAAGVAVREGNRPLLPVQDTPAAIRTADR